MKRFVRVFAVLFVALTAAFALPGLLGEAKAESKYYIKVDITNQYVTVYRSSDDEIVRQMICSTGKSSTPTITGTFTLPAKSRASERTKWYTFADCYAQYATRIRGPYLFHSYLFSSKRDSAVIRSSVSALGSQASHGCIRLRIADAKWIAKNCAAGTRVRIYSSGKRDSAIRSLLLKGSFSISDGKSYEEWAGKGGEGELGRGDYGAKVKQLQQRLVGMGYAKMSADSEYGQKTIDAVKAFQKKAGLNQTGVTDDATWNALFADDAPAGDVKSTLYEGTNGKLVSDFQTTLAALKFYSGDIDGVFDAEVTAAVNEYKKVHGMSQNGKLNFDNRAKAAKEADDLAARFGESEYELKYVNYDVEMAKVRKSKKYIYMRKKGKTTAKKLMKLTKGTEMTVLEKGDVWTKVTKGDKTGYAQTKYIKFFTETRTRVEYQAVAAPTVEPSPTETTEPTPDESAEPTTEPTTEPTAEPTTEPTTEPTAEPSTEPTAAPEA